MTSRPDRLLADEIVGSLGECVIGRRIIVLESTGSTNDFLWQMLTPELPEGFVVFAEQQTTGRGQRGNSWSSAAHLGLWFSLLLRPRLPAGESVRLTNWAAEAIATTIRAETGLDPAIKPPNDVLIAKRKVAGILVETKVEHGHIGAAVVGIGVNVNHAAEDFPVELRPRAGSLALALGCKIERPDFAIALLRELEHTRGLLIDAPRSSQTLSSRSAVGRRGTSQSE